MNNWVTKTKLCDLLHFLHSTSVTEQDPAGDLNETQADAGETVSKFQQNTIFILNFSAGYLI